MFQQAADGSFDATQTGQKMYAEAEIKTALIDTRFAGHIVYFDDSVNSKSVSMRLFSAPIDISQYICPEPTWSPTADPTTSEPTTPTTEPSSMSPTAAPTQTEESTPTTEPSMNPTAASEPTISTTSTSSVIGSKLNRMRVQLAEDSNDFAVADIGAPVGLPFYIRVKWKDTLYVFISTTIISITVLVVFPL